MGRSFYIARFIIIVVVIIKVPGRLSVSCHVANMILMTAAENKSRCGLQCLTMTSSSMNEKRNS